LAIFIAFISNVGHFYRYNLQWRPFSPDRLLGRPYLLTICAFVAQLRPGGGQLQGGLGDVIMQ